MKIENLIFSLVILLFAILALAAMGWLISFTFAPGITVADGTPPSDLEFFGLRVSIGIIFLGLINGMSKLWDLFYFCMTQAPTGK